MTALKGCTQHAKTDLLIFMLLVSNWAYILIFMVDGYIIFLNVTGERILQNYAILKSIKFHFFYLQNEGSD